MNLTLNLKAKYWHQIKRGEKKFEYRLATPYWTKRLKGRTYDKIHICWGYPKKGDMSRIIEFPWNGYTLGWVCHEEWNHETKMVFAITLKEKANVKI